MEAPGAYNLDHEPIGLLEAADLLHRIRDRTLATTTLEGHRVCTVFLVFDRGRGQGQPILYETRVVDVATGAEQWAERYPNRHAALAGHDRAVAWVRSPVALAATTSTHPARRRRSGPGRRASASPTRRPGPRRVS